MATGWWSARRTCRWRFTGSRICTRVTKNRHTAQGGAIMTNDKPTDDVTVSAEALKQAEKYVEEEEGAARDVKGKLGLFLTGVAVAMSVFHLYTAYGIVPAQILR